MLIEHAAEPQIRDPGAPDLPEARERPAVAARAQEHVELLAREMLSLDIFWLKDESVEDSANLPAPAVIAAEIAEDLRAALE